MVGRNSAAPVIIRRKKVVGGGGHHGGAWKVAYADFVTAMMAFFMLMWLLNATTEKQRKGIADYFSPTIPVNRVSGGGDGAFGGDSVFSQDQMAQSGTGGTTERSATERRARGQSGVARIDPSARSATDAALHDIESRLLARAGESIALREPLRHIVTRITDEGLIVEMFDLPGAPLFMDDTAQPAELTRQLTAMIAGVFGMAKNRVAVNGYVKSYPVVLIHNPVWDLSIGRAKAVRDLLQASGLPRERSQRITGFADRKPATPNRTAVRNNRIEVILLRKSR